MALFAVEVTEEAKGDLDFYTAAIRKAIVTGIRKQLLYEPLVETKNRKLKYEDSEFGSGAAQSRSRHRFGVGRTAIAFDG